MDKTALVQQLIAGGKYYFLSRPRRFGKSLLLDTVKELFEANQALFAGLAIHEGWNWSQCHPVLLFSFAGAEYHQAIDLDQVLHQQLEQFERKFDLPARYPDRRSRFTDLLQRLHAQSGQRVVVLVDEYDKPLLDNIAEPATATVMRDGLKDFYSVIKAMDAHVQFAMLTGVSKFSKVSLFSGLNNLEDITLDPNFSALCGYTDIDLDTVFASELTGLDRTQIKRWYNGYRWLGQAVYNPYDVLLLLKRRVFKAWWFETGTPTFLVKLMAERGFFTPDLACLRTGEELISTFDVEHISLEALLFQTGYLTIHEQAIMPSGQIRYQMGYPNQEVETSLNASLLASYTDDASRGYRQRARLEEYLLAHDMAGVQEVVQSLFASIPHQWFDNNPISRYEGYYASVFYSHFAALGYPLQVEDATNHDRIDMSVRLPQAVYLFEFKVVDGLAQGKALQQLKDKAYAEKYRALGLPVYLVGVEFSREARNVVGFEVG
ncbi:MAG: hypothetical protein RL748_904 [Pseudomonadota bacterium]